MTDDAIPFDDDRDRRTPPEAVPVTIEAPNPIPVVVTPDPPPVAVTLPSGQMVATPTTTEEEDRGTAGQRTINAMWEGTQRLIAIGFAYGSILICAFVIVWGKDELKLAALTYILTMGATVNQSYFTRTNHTKVGGVKYEGR